jgi:hypothetical protein
MTMVRYLLLSTESYMNIFVYLPCYFTFYKKMLQKFHLSKIYHHIKFDDPSLSDTSVVPTPSVCMPTILLLLIVAN